MARVETIIVGGGIGAGAPFALNHFMYVGSIDPPLAVSSVQMVEVLAPGNPGIVISPTGADPKASATETLRLSGGFISQGAGTDSFLAGRGASAAGTRGIAIGLSAASGTGAGNVVVGANITLAVGSGQNTVVGDGSSTVGGSGQIFGAASLIESAGAQKSTIVGNGSTITSIFGAGGPGYGIIVGAGTTIQFPGGSAGGTIAIGNSISAVRSDNCVLVGDAATATVCDSATGVGFSVDLTATATVVGAGAQGTHDGAIALGVAAATVAANSCTIGGTTAQGRITQILVGRGDTHTAAVDLKFRMTNGSGADLQAGTMTLQPGISTGNATPGGLNVDMGIAGGSGSGLQTIATRMAVRPSVTALDTWLMVWDVDNASLERVSVGAADSGGTGFKVLRIAN